MSGIYSFPNIPTGNYYVFANAPQYERGFYKNPADGSLKVVEVDADDQEVIGINIQLAPQNDPPPPPLHGSISGTVFGADNTIVRNVTVGVVTTGNLTQPIFVTHTNFYGTYFFHDLQAGTYKTCVMGLNTLPTFYSSEITIVNNSLIDSVNIYTDLPPQPSYGSVSGYVIGAENNGENPNNHEMLSVGVVTLDNLTTILPGHIGRVGHEGYYFICSLPVGTYKTCLLDENLAPVAYSEPVTVIANQVVENVNIIAGADSTIGFTISGTAFNAQNLPLQNGIVELRSAHDSTNVYNHHQHRTAHISPSGTYTIMNVPAGQYILSMWSHMSPVVFYPSTFDIQQTVPVNVVDQDLINLNISIPVEQNFHISGYVLDDLTDAFLEGIVVKTDRMGFHHFPMQDSLFTNEFTAVTDASGFFSIEAPVGRYTVVALDPTHTYRHQFYDHSPNPFHAQVITLNHDYTNILFHLMTVQDSMHYSISGVVTENGEAITYPVRVVAVSSDEDWEDSAITHPDGSYTIHNLRPGSYYVVAYSLYNAPSFYNNAINWEDAEQIIVNGEIANINFDLTNDGVDGSSNLSGVISATNGAGVENALVMLTNSQNQVIGFARTDEQGQYSITNVPSQSYTVVATKFGVPTATQNLYLLGSDNLDMTLNVVTANEDNTIPVATSKISNYPNPFNPNTNINFSIPKDSRVNVQIYNIKGQNIKTLMNLNLKAGTHSLAWDGTDNSGNKVTSGIYLVKLSGNGFVSNHKMSLLK